MTDSDRVALDFYTRWAVLNPDLTTDARTRERVWTAYRKTCRAYVRDLTQRRALADLQRARAHVHEDGRPCNVDDPGCPTCRTVIAAEVTA